MRLLDKVLSQWPMDFREQVKSVASRPDFACVVADRIACDYYENKKEIWGYSDFPYCVPPWGESFIEWSQSEKIYFKGEWIDGCTSSQFGAFVSCPWTDAKDCRSWLMSRLAGSDAIIKTDEVLSATRAFILRQVAYWEGKIINYDYMRIVFTNDDGLPLACVVAGEPSKPRPKMTSGGQLDDETNSIFHIVGLALTFLNCKNVKTEDKTDEFQPSAKIRRRLKIPEIKRYALNISGRSTNQKNSTPGTTGIMPFHLCRGHFATYTEENPLFGRYTGKFWIPAHVKGRKENGEIVKDYSIG